MPIIRCKFKEIYLENAPGQSEGWTWKNINNLRNRDGKLCELRPINEPYTYTGTSQVGEFKSPYIVFKGLDKIIPNIIGTEDKTYRGGGYGVNIYIKYKYENRENLDVYTSKFTYQYPDGIEGYPVVLVTQNSRPNGLITATNGSLDSGEDLRVNFVRGIELGNDGNSYRDENNNIITNQRRVLSAADYNDPEFKIRFGVNFKLNFYDSNLHTFGIDYVFIDIIWNDKTSSFTSNFLSASHLERNTGSTVKPSAQPLPGFTWNNTSNALQDNFDNVISNYSPPTPFNFNRQSTVKDPGDKYFYYTDYLLFQNINYKIPDFILDINGNIIPTILSGMVFRFKKKSEFKSFDTNKIAFIRFYDETVRVHNGTQFFGKNNLIPKEILPENVFISPWRDNTGISDFGAIPDKTSGAVLNNQVYGSENDNWELQNFTPNFLNNNNFGIAVAGYGYFTWWEYSNQNSFPYPLGIDYGDITFYFGLYKFIEYISVYEGIYEVDEFLSNKHKIIRAKSNITGIIVTQEEIKRHNIIADQAFTNKILESQEKLEKHNLVKFGVLTNKRFGTNEVLGKSNLFLRLYIVNKILESQEQISKNHKLNRPEPIFVKNVDKIENFGLNKLTTRAFLIQKQIVDSSEISSNNIETKAVISPKSIQSDESIRRVFVDTQTFPTQRILDVTIQKSQEEVNTNALLFIKGQPISGVNNFQLFENIEFDNSPDSVNYDWVNLSNVANYNDGNFCEISWVNNSEIEPLSNSNYVNTDYLVVKNPNPENIPDNAVITGIKVIINKFGSNFTPSGYRTEDLEVRLTLNGNYIGENKAIINEAWPKKQQGFQLSTYGSLNDKWGLNLVGNDIKNNTFGVAIRARFKYGNLTDSDFVSLSEKYNVAIDYVGIEFAYLIPLPNIQPKSINTSEQLSSKNKLSTTDVPLEGCLNMPFENFENQPYTDDGDLTARYIWKNESGAKNKGDESTSSIEKLEP